MRPSGVSGQLRWGCRLAALVVTAITLAGVSGSVAAARLPSCYYHYFSAGWAVRSAKLTLVRSGTWTSLGSTVTGTETDTMSPVTHPQAYKDGLYLSQLCSPWNLSLTESRPGSENAQWSTTEPGSGGCSVHQSFPVQNGFVLDVGGAPRRVADKFKLTAKQVRIFVAVMVPPGLSCQGPLGNATFDFPFQRFVSSTPVTIAARTLTQNRAFTLKFTGSAAYKEPWDGGIGGYPIGSEQFQLTWSGVLSFKPTGCAENTEASLQTRPVCYPS